MTHRQQIVKIGSPEVQKISKIIPEMPESEVFMGFNLP